MKDFLRKIRLADHLTIELEIDKTDFFKILQSNVDESQSDFFDAFSGGKNEYKGIVTPDSFEIKRKRRLFDMNFNFARAKGTMIQRHSKLVIDTEINAFRGRMIFLFISLIVFYSVFIIAFATADDINRDAPGFVFPFILLHALFMFGIPYLIVRRSLSRMKYDLERDFYFMIKKIKTSNYSAESPAGKY